MIFIIARQNVTYLQVLHPVLDLGALALALFTSDLSILATTEQELKGESRWKEISTN
jgi:hypothetical protein